MRYDLSILLPDSDSRAGNILALSLVIAGTISALVGVVGYFFGMDILNLLRIPQMAPYIWLLPISVFVYGAYIALNAWNTRTRNFSRLSVARVMNVVSANGAKVGAGFAGYATAGTMIAANIGGQAISAAVLAGRIWRDNGSLLKDSVRVSEMLSVTRRYKRFPLYSSWSALLNIVSWQLPALALGVFFSPAVVGYYALGFRILQLPMSMVGTSIGEVFFQRASEVKDDGNLPALVEKLFCKLLTIALLPTLILAIIGQDLFAFVFGAEWLKAGIYAQILAPWVLVWFISSPLSTVYAVLEKQSQEPVMQGLIFVTRLIAIVAGGFYGSPIVTMMLFSMSGIISYGYLIKKIFGFCDLRATRVFRRSVGVIMTAFAAIIPLLVVKLYDQGLVVLLLVTAASVLFYGYIHRGIVSSLKRA